MFPEKNAIGRLAASWFASILIAGSTLMVRPGSVEAADLPISFRNDVIPVLTKAGCNMGTCHAKAGGGQKGFQLSLLGFEPADDYESIVAEGRGRRLFFADPDRSLLLLKGTGKVPHGGGTRLSAASAGYRILRDWIAQGVPTDGPNLPSLVSLEVEPSRKTLLRDASQQLKVVARYSDGAVRDVTAMALFESNDRAMTDVSDSGLVKVLDVPGKASVMVRYQGKVAMFHVVVPLGAPIASMPPIRNFVDAAVFANLKELGIPPSPTCDDSTFLRRATLDIAGRLPTEAEARTFLANPAADKRDQWIEELLRSPDYADYFAGKWAAVLKNRREDAADMVSNFAFHAWVRDSLLSNKPYDQFVRELLAATGTVIENPPVAWYKRVRDPKEQIEDVAQLFLGVRMQCAQCHHHPFERWSQDDYYSLVAFFSQVGRKPSDTRGEDLIFHKRGSAAAINIKTKAVLKPAALGDAVDSIAPGADPRLRLADWMRSPNNPFFAKVLVNRYWKHFFQRGLIEPEDDIRDSNPASNPELLAALEKHFIRSGFDLKDLVRTIVRSSAYQLSATPNRHNKEDRQNYSRFYPRRLPAEVLLDAMDQLAGTQTDFPNLPAGTRAVALPDNSYNQSSPFLRVFGRPEAQSACECERVQTSSLGQSLHLLNGQDIRSKLGHPNGRAMRLAADGRPAETRISELYMAAFAREPRPEELKTALNHLAETRTNASGQKWDAQRTAQEAFQDLIWALSTTKEFVFNH